MREYLPLIIIGAIIGAFTVIFLAAFLLLKRQKDPDVSDRHMKDGELLRRLGKYAKPHWRSFIAIFCIMVISVRAGVSADFSAF